MKQRVLFVCIHNSARSQMAETFLNLKHGDRYEAESAGIEPGRLNPFVVAAMADLGIDISKNKTKSVHDLLKAGKSYDYVVTVCDKEAAEKCPLFPGRARRLHWGFPDPSAATGSTEEKLQKAREVRDIIRQHINDWEKHAATAV
jgi:arsenate reductase (thioredoxin)